MNTWASTNQQQAVENEKITTSAPLVRVSGLGFVPGPTRWRCCLCPHSGAVALRGAAGNHIRLDRTTVQWLACDGGHIGTLHRRMLPSRIVPQELFGKSGWEVASRPH